jgi:hypothetical protein
MFLFQFFCVDAWLNAKAQLGEIADNHACTDNPEEIAETIYLL